MKERPILFNAQMVRALLNGTKTQTRRVVKQSLVRLGDGDFYAFDHKGINYRVNARHTTVAAWANLLQFCSYGQRGDRLWVREAWRIGAWNSDEGTVALDYLADGHARKEWITVHDDEVFNRLWQQSTDDAERAHGVDSMYQWEPGQSPCRGRPSIHMPRWASRITLEIVSVRVERLQDIIRGDAMAEGCPFPNMADGPDPTQWYADLWQQINGPGSWSANPWVWVVEFKPVTLDATK